jgi:hypothetical protein
MLETKPWGLLFLLVLAFPALVALTVTVAVFCLGRKWKTDQDQDSKSA